MHYTPSPGPVKNDTAPQNIVDNALGIGDTRIMDTRETASGFWGGLDDAPELETDRAERQAHYAELRARRADYTARTGLESPTLDLDEYLAEAEDNGA